MELSLTCGCCGEEAFEVVVAESSLGLLNGCHSSLQAALDGRDRQHGKKVIGDLLVALERNKPVLGGLDEYESTLAMLNRAYAAAQRVTGPAAWAFR